MSLFAFARDVLSGEDCDELLRLAPPGSAGGPDFLPVDATHPAVVRVVAYMDVVNAERWRCPRDEVWVNLGVYRAPSPGFPRHVDYQPRDPSQRCITFASSVLLSLPDTFTGGDLVVGGGMGGDVVRVPRQRGGVAVFNGFVPHEVTPVTSGTRVAVVTFALFGPTNAEAHARGWPDRWIAR